MSFPAVCVCGRDRLLSSQSPAYHEDPVRLNTESPHSSFGSSVFSTFDGLAGGYHRNAPELSAYPRGLRTLDLSRIHFLRLGWL